MNQTLFPLGVAAAAHPAKYSDALLVTMAHMLQGRRRVLDPFGGTGKIFLLQHWLPDTRFDALEIEPEWAARNPATTLGNALDMPWDRDTFDGICTSPVYGNRMSDQQIDDKWERFTYTAKLGRKLHHDNAGRLYWGPAYRALHERAWVEARRVLQVGGVFVLNIKDHYRKEHLQPVTQWHIDFLCAIGFRQVQHEHIKTPHMGRGSHAALRVPYESLVKFILESK